MAVFAKGGVVRAPNKSPDKAVWESRDVEVPKSPEISGFALDLEKSLQPSSTPVSQGAFQE